MSRGAYNKVVDNFLYRAGPATHLDLFSRVPLPRVWSKIPVEPAERVPLGIESAGIPRFEGVFDVSQSRTGKLRVVPEYHGLEVGMVNPLKAFPGVCLLVIVVGVEAVRLESASRVQNEYLEQRFAESEPGGAMPLSECANQQIKFLHVTRLVPVNLLELPNLFDVVGEVAEFSNGIKTQLSA